MRRIPSTLIRTSLFVVTLAGPLLAADAHAQTADNLLVLINETSAASVQIGEYYARKRAVPANQVLRIKTAIAEDIARSDFEQQIEAPIARWLERQGAHDRILYLVLTKGVPLRIVGSAGRDGTVASVDSELTLLYRKLTGRALPPQGRVPNPYFLADAPLERARPFTHETADIFVVTRLDGFTIPDVLALIDRGLTPARAGRIVLDGKAAWDNTGNRWLQGAADRLRTQGLGDGVVFDATSRILSNETGLLGYYSWGSNDPALKDRRPNLSFVPGALAGMFVSTDARTFAEPPAAWTIGPWTNRASFFGGSPQSLIGDLIRLGVTGVSGHVAEPYLDGTARPEILFPAYLAGFNLAESFYLAVPYVSWQTIVIGDPLCAPLKTKPLGVAAIDNGLDAATGFPQFFGAHRSRALAEAGIKPALVTLLMKAEASLARGDVAAGRSALEQTIQIDDTFTLGHVRLAALYEQAGDHDKAIARYRAVLTRQPNHAVALNNLAYALAEHARSPHEALPLAQQAYALMKGSPAVMDTLGWILHLVGENGQASGVLAAAVKGDPANAEIRRHAAIVYAETGHLEAAVSELTRALELDPSSAERDDVKRLRAKLKASR